MTHISLAAEPVFHLGGFAFTNSMATSLVATVLMLFLLVGAARQMTLFPRKGFAQVIESIIEALLTLIEQVTHSREKAVKFFPLLATFFVFILVNNWLGLVPGVGSLIVRTPEGTVPLFRGANADLNTTLALAVISVILTQAYAIRELGLFGHLKKYFSFNPILLFIGLLELLSEFSKMVSFSFRLFGNIFAGEVLLAVISYLVPIIGPLPFFGLEIFVGLIQALVFTMLTLVFLEMTAANHSSHPSPSPSKASEKNMPYLFRRSIRHVELG